MGHDLKGAVEAHDEAFRTIKLAYHRSGIGESALYIQGLDAARETWRTLLAELSRLQEENGKYRAALLHIVETDWHTRQVRPKPEGGIRGFPGLTAVRALTGLHGSYTSDAEVRAALASQDQGGGDRG